MITHSEITALQLIAFSESCLRHLFISEQNSILWFQLQTVRRPFHATHAVRIVVVPQLVAPNLNIRNSLIWRGRSFRIEILVAIFFDDDKNYKYIFVAIPL